MIFLDSASTTYPKFTSGDTLTKFWFNVNTPYAMDARKLLEGAEKSVKDSLGVKGGRVIFGGTATLMFECLFDRMSSNFIDSLDDEDFNAPSKHYCMMGTPYEHDCIDGHGVSIHNINSLCDIRYVESWKTSTPILFSQLVSNITGDVFPVEQIGSVARQLDGYFVCDMTSSIGKYPIPDNLESFCDAIISSSHKFHGEKGTGFMWVSDRFNRWLRDIDGQEIYYLGTPDQCGAWATACALHRAVDETPEEEEWDNAVRNALYEQGVKYETMGLSDGIVDYSHSIICLRIKGVYADALQNFLANRDIYIGVGHSSCEDGENRYRVLMNAGYTEKEASECIRLSFDGGAYPTAQDEIDTFAKAVKDFIEMYGVSQEDEDEGN